MKKPIPFGKYYLMDRVAVGGMAEVFKAKTFGIDGFEKVVALKRILPNIAEDEEFITMFTDEAKIAVKLSHANIVQIFQLGQEEGSYFIAMEYIHGRDMRTIFDRSRRKGAEKLDPKLVAYIIARVCEGLDYAHRKKDDNGQPLHIVHRDVSPQNILISYEGDVKVIDFGVAKAQNKMSRTQAGILKGKFAYMSPEQIQGLPLDQRSDIFALGVVFYEVLTGARLFVGESDFHTLEMIRNMDIDPPSSKNPDIPPALDEIALKALARDPNQRYTWASEMHEDLQRFLYSHPPIFTRQDLAQFVRRVFDADIEKEKQRSAAYEPFFQHMRENPALYATPQALPQAPPPQYHQERSSPSAPHSASYSGGFPQATGHTPSHSGPHPHPVVSGSYTPPQHAVATAGASPYGAATPPPGFPGHGSGNSYPHSAGHYGSDDIGESTMHDPSGRMLAAHLANSQAGPPPMPMPAPTPPPSPYGVPASPYGVPPQAEAPPDVGFDDLYEDDAEESDTIIDLSIDDSGSSKKWLWIGLSLMVVLGAAGIGVWLFLRSQTVEPPPQMPPGKLYVVFRKPVKNLKFYLDGKPFPFANLKVISNQKIQLNFPNGGKHKLTIVRDGYQTITQRVSIERGDEMQTPFLRMIPKEGTLRLETKPDKAVVFVDGNLQRGQTPMSLRLPAGPHQIQIMKQGRKPWEERLIVTHDKVLTKAVSLSRTKAVLTVVCRAGEGKARIYINGRYKGQAPKEFSLNPMRTYRLVVKPMKYKKSYEDKVSFPLSPTKRISVDCVAPKPNARGFIKILALPRAKVWINDKYKGVTPLNKVTLKPGQYQVRLVNLTTKQLHKAILNITTGPNPPFIINQWK